MIDPPANIINYFKLFNTAEEAGVVYQKAAKEHYGEFV
jgi:hypothetical protein